MMVPARHNVRTASAFLGVGRSTLYGLLDTHRLPYYRILGKIVVDERDLKEYMRQCRVTDEHDLARLKKAG